MTAETINDPMAHITIIIGVWTIIAIVLGPLIALQIQKWIENWKEKKQRKLAIFKTLMAAI
jgi:hypothetical protein